MSGEARPIFIDSKTLNSNYDPFFLYSIIVSKNVVQTKVEHRRVRHDVLERGFLDFKGILEFSLVLHIFGGVHRLLFLDRDRLRDLLGNLRANVDIVVERLLEVDFLVVLIEHFDVEAQRLQLLDEHAEGLRHARLGHILALDNRLIGAHASHHVVGLDG